MSKIWYELIVGLSLDIGLILYLHRWRKERISHDSLVVAYFKVDILSFVFRHLVELSVESCLDRISLKFLNVKVLDLSGNYYLEGWYNTSYLIIAFAN